jgi:adenosylhomocysteine nucleosidase
MSVDGREAAAAAASSAVVVVMALGVERACLRRHSGRPGGSRLLLAQSGPGAERAAAAAAVALASGASALVSWGLAGGLDSDLAPGDVVLPRLVSSLRGEAFGVDSGWHAAIEAGLRGAVTVRVADVVSVPGALTTPADKTAAAAACGAGAADMESAAVAAAAARAGARFAAVRVIVDTANDFLPADAERWIDERGERRFGRALAAAFQPAQWRELWILAHRYRAARRTLERVAELAAKNDFWAPRALAG